jgi:hypothetical protein
VCGCVCLFVCISSTTPAPMCVLYVYMSVSVCMCMGMVSSRISAPPYCLPSLRPATPTLFSPPLLLFVLCFCSYCARQDDPSSCGHQDGHDHPATQVQATAQGKEQEEEGRSSHQAEMSVVCLLFFGHPLTTLKLSRLCAVRQGGVLFPSPASKVLIDAVFVN